MTCAILVTTLGLCSQIVQCSYLDASGPGADLFGEMVSILAISCIYSSWKVGSSLALYVLGV